nr:pollen-specific leucine-rich repeat extensin-like protein 1 isoform X3 [Lepeophtheirus salmonis]
MKVFVVISALLALASANQSSHQTIQHGHAAPVHTSIHRPHGVHHASVVSQPAADPSDVHNPYTADYKPIAAVHAPAHAPVHRPAPYHPAPYHPAPVVHRPAPYHPAPVVHKPSPYHAAEVYGDSPPSTNTDMLSLMTMLEPTSPPTRTETDTPPTVNTELPFPMAAHKLFPTTLLMLTLDMLLMSDTKESLITTPTSLLTSQLPITLLPITQLPITLLPITPK